MKSWWAGLVLAAIMGSGDLAAATAAGRAADPVVLRGDQLGQSLGRPPAALRLYAYHGGWSPVVFQIDERMMVTAYRHWGKAERFLSYAFDSGPKAKPDPDPAFDADDELVFMAADAGPRAPEGGGPPGSSVCDEIALHDPDTGADSYTYLCAFTGAPPLSGERLVTMKGDDEISARGYEVAFPPGNPINFKSFQVRGPGGLMTNVVDRFKMQYQIAIVFNVASYTLSDAEAHHLVRGVRNGPVRIIKEVDTQLETWPEAQIKSFNHVFFYPDQIEYDFQIRGPANWGKYMHASDLVLALDLNNQGRGMSFFSEKDLAGEAIDGKPDTSEIKMDYGPTEWVGVSGQDSGSILLHLGLDPRMPLYKDLYYVDNDMKADPGEDVPGMIGKSGFIVRNLHKAGFRRFPVRFTVMGRPEAYAPGQERELLTMYQRPLRVQVGGHQLQALPPDAPAVSDTRKEQPRSIFAEQEQTKQFTKIILPNFILDPNLLGSGPGIGYSDNDFLGIGANFSISGLWTERGYASYGASLSNLRFIKGIESLRLDYSINSFPAQPFYGLGNDPDIEHLSLYWWRRTEGDITFSKRFADVYGADFRVGLRQFKIASGIKPRSGTGNPSIEEHFGKDRELRGARWGDPVFGRQGGNLNVVSVALYHDMRNDKNLPHFGSYQQFTVDVVSPTFGADYNYTRATLDLRGYWHPDFLNPISLDGRIDPRHTLVSKFVGPDKDRSFAGRVTFIHLIADEVDFGGRQVLDVPFYELTALGSSSNVKGFNSSRFIDNDAVWGSLEYRWNWWKFTEAALFVDAGMVMDSVLNSKSYDQKVHWSYGFSARINVPPNIIITGELAWSEEHAAYFQQMNIGF